jgi:transposase InsO family protein
MTYPLVLDLAAPGAPLRVPGVVTCRVLGFSKQAFYKWKKNPINRRDWSDAHLINSALDIHRDGKLYLCAIKDVYSNWIVGYSIDSRMKASLAVAAVRNSISMRTPAGTVVHSDRGSQFRSKALV